MNRTECIVLFPKNSTFLIDDILSITSTDENAQSNHNDITLPFANTKPCATYEQNYWLLDGNFAVGARTGYISQSQTGSSGTGSTANLTIEFNSTHTLNVINLYFQEWTSDYCSSFSITYYDNLGGLVRTDTYTPTSYNFTITHLINNIKKIVFQFTNTNNAYRFVRLLALDFDDSIVFSGSEIRNAKLTEQLDPLSLELPINTLDLELYSATGDFSIVAPAGFYASLQDNQPLDVYEMVNGIVLLVGRYYLEEWHSESEKLAQFKAYDAIGLMDKIDYPGFFLESFNTTISNIFTFINLSYSLDSSFSSISPYYIMYLDKMSVRSALQFIACSIGAYVTCARSKTVSILPMQLASSLVTYDHTFTKAQKGIESPMSLKPLVTGVEVTSHSYDPGGTLTEDIFNQSLAVGTYTIYYGLGVPLWSTGLSGAALAAPISPAVDYANSISFTVSSPGTVHITGIRYIHSQKIHGVYNGSLPANTPLNIIRVQDDTCITPLTLAAGYVNGDTVAQRLYDYFLQRYVQKTKLIAQNIKPGDSVLIDVQSGKQMAGIIEQIDWDLGAGYIADVQIVGVILP